MCIGTNRKLFKIFIILVVMLLLTACSGNTESNKGENEITGNNNAEEKTLPLEEEKPPTEPPPETTMTQVTHAGVTLFYDPSLIMDIEASTIPASEGGPYEAPHPAYVQFSLVLEGGTVSAVFMPAYKAVFDSAGETFNALQSLITGKTYTAGECIPELPLMAFYQICGHQQFNSNVVFLDFQNGSGVRFVTVYGIQDAAPITNENLVYLFQGITDDGQCYLRVDFKMVHTGLEDTGEIPLDIYSDPSGAALLEYFKEYETLLNEQESGFSPPLSVFDEIISSLQIENCGGG